VYAGKVIKRRAQIKVHPQRPPPGRNPPQLATGTAQVENAEARTLFEKVAAGRQKVAGWPNNRAERESMPDDDRLPAPIPAPTRDRVVRRLSAHFAADHIGVEELERRLDLVYSAKSRDALEALTGDLPALEGGHDEAVRAASAAIRPERAVADNDFIVAIMGGAERKGSWTPPHKLSVLALMGGAGLDFREAVFGAPTTEVTALAIMGGVEIIVPPGVRVETNGLAIMGGFEGGSAPETSDRAPLVRVRGLALMGAVEVTVRLPGETEKAARRRLKQERKRIEAEHAGRLRLDSDTD